MTKASGISYTLAEIAVMLNAEINGNSEERIHGLTTLQHAASGKIAFLANPIYKKYLESTQASAVLVTPDVAQAYAERAESHSRVNLVVMDNPYLGYAKLSQKFDTAYNMTAGIHPSAVLAEGVVVPESCQIGPNVVIESGVLLGEGVHIGANSVVGKNCRIGHNSYIWANVTLYSQVQVGERCIIHSGTVVGSDGFGNAQDSGQWVKIAQLGGVRIGSDVEIGSNTAIDRGALEDTIIEDGVRIDNLVQIAHNVKIGAHSALAGCSAVAGSTTIGKHCVIAGGVGIAGHLEITDQVVLTGMTMATKNINKPGAYSSGTAIEPNSSWRKTVARLRNIDSLFKRLKAVEKKLNL